MLCRKFWLIAWAVVGFALPSFGYAQACFLNQAQVLVCPSPTAPSAATGAEVPPPEVVSQDSTPSIRGGATRVNALGAARTRFRLPYLVQSIQERGDEQGGGAAADGLAEPTSLVIGATSESNDRPDTALVNGFDSDANAAMLGVDHRFGDSWVLGGFVDYQNVDTDFGDPSAFQDMDEVGGAVYSYSSVGDAGFVSLLLRYGDQDYDIQRQTSAGIAFGSTQGNRVTASIAAGADKAYGATTVSLQGLLDYERTEVDGYTADAGGIAVNFSDDEIKSLIGSIRGSVSHAVSTGFGILVPQVFAAYAHEFQRDARVVTADSVAFALPDLFVTEDPDRNWFTLGANLSVVWPYGWSGFVNLEGDVARSDRNRFVAEIGIRKAF